MRRPSLRWAPTVARPVRRAARRLRPRRADPIAELTRALDGARSSHVRLSEQVASLVTAQKQAEIRLHGKFAELARTTEQARRALLAADTVAGAATNVGTNEGALNDAELAATRLVQLDRDIESLTALVVESTRAVDVAKAALADDAAELRERILRAARGVDQATQAAEAERIAEVLDLLDATVGDDVPPVADVERRIQRRHARARTGQLDTTAPATDDHLIATARLDELRDELGITRGAGPDRPGG